MTTASTVQFIPAEPILESISELRALLERLAEPADAQDPVYLPLSKLARYFGISRSLAGRYVAAAISAGRLEHLSPVLNGVKGNHLYSVRDFKKYLSNPA